jgi:hypothetical protein
MSERDQVRRLWAWTGLLAVVVAAAYGLLWVASVTGGGR